MKGIAHRGLSSVAPENTAEAIIAAAKAGFKYVEFDVRLTADNVAVLRHDNYIDLGGGGNGNISDIPYEHMKPYLPDLLTLDEALTLCKRLGLHPYIDMKVDYDVTMLRETLFCFGFDNVTVLTTNPEWYATLAMDGIRIGYVTSSISTNIIIQTMDNAALQANLNPAQTELLFVDLDYNATLDMPDISILAHSYDVEVWTVDNAAALDDYAMKYYVRGVTSNVFDASQVLYNNAIGGN